MHSIDELIKSDNPKMVFEKYRHLYTKLSNTQKDSEYRVDEFFKFDKQEK